MKYGPSLSQIIINSLTTCLPTSVLLPETACLVCNKKLEDMPKSKKKHSLKKKRKYQDRLRCDADVGIIIQGILNNYY